MRITDLLNENNIDLSGKVANKSDCINRMIDLMETSGNIIDKEAYKKDNVHLDVLSNLSMLLMNEQFTEKLRNAKSKEEFLQYIDEAENVKEEKEEEKEKKAEVESQKGYEVLAVTES